MKRKSLFPRAGRSGGSTRQELARCPLAWNLFFFEKSACLLTYISKVEIFLTPEQKMIANRQLAIDHMVKMMYSGEEVTKMQSGLKRWGT